jgi:trans-aconitate methyltransferase
MQFSEKKFLKGGNYNEKAIVQMMVARDLVDFAIQDLQFAKTVLDVGCGTGFVGREILKKFSKNGPILIGLEPSLEMSIFAKPYYDEIFSCKFEDFKEKKADLMISSMCFQWIENFEESLTRFDKSWFAMPLEGSLHELENAFLNAGLKSPILQFKKPTFKAFAIKEYALKFKTALQALKSFNEIGAKVETNIKISHNEIKSLERFFNGVISWKIGFFNF